MRDRSRSRSSLSSGTEIDSGEDQPSSDGQRADDGSGSGGEGGSGGAGASGVGKPSSDGEGGSGGGAESGGGGSDGGQPSSDDEGGSGIGHPSSDSESASGGDGGFDTSLSDTCSDGDCESGGARNNDRLQHTALAADRYDVPSRTAAALINAFQQDIGRVTPEDTTFVLAPMKLWRARKRVRAETAQEAASAASAAPIRGLYFDGRKDKTAVSSSASTREEHVVVLKEPGAEYLGHVTPKSGRAADVFTELYAVAQQFGADIRVLGCDGTAVNTGVRGGICRLFETFSGSAVHWFICQLHANELNLRSVFQVGMNCN